MFDLKHKILAALAVLFLIFCVVAVWFYIDERIGRVKAETVQQEQAKAQAQIKEASDKLAEQHKAWEAEQQQKLLDMQKTFGQAQSPQQIANLVAQYMGTKQPITFVTPPATAANPNPQPVAQVAVSDAPQIKAYLQECETCKFNLSKAQTDLTYEQQQHDLTKQTLLSVTQQRDEWKKTAQGGSWMRKTLRIVKLAGCSGLGAAAGTGLQSSTSGGSKAGGAAIGAVGGAIVCSLF
jgi:hypothetical protein